MILAPIIGKENCQLRATLHRSRSYARYSADRNRNSLNHPPLRSPFRRLQQPVTSGLHGLITFAGGFSQSGHVCNFDLAPAVADDTGLLKRLATIETALRCTPIICARHSWVSGKLSLSVRSQAHNSQRDKRASTECEALQAAACWACAARRCSCRARRARRAALRSAAARRTAASRIEAVPDKRTAASVNAIPPSSAAETPKTLSRPTNTTSTDCPSERRTAFEMMALCGR